MEGSYPFSTEPIYRRDTTSPSDKATLDEITAPRHWDSDRFKAVMIATAVLNNGQAIPAPNRPDSINLASWKPFLEELQQRTINEGRETGRVVLADVERQSLVMGKSASGEEYHVSVDPTPQPGREHAQRIVAALLATDSVPEIIRPFCQIARLK